MKKVYLVSQVDEEKCVGDRFCETACPTGAIKMVKRKAVVDSTKCAACLRCLDACEEGAIMVIPRQQPLTLGIDPAGLEQAEIAELCDRAHLDPEERICVCMEILAKEVAAAVLKGAQSLEQVSRMTGVRTSCGMWCMAPVQRLLQAHGNGVKPGKGHRWYPIETGVWKIPEKVARKYPEYSLEEDREQFQERALENLVSIFKAK